MFGRHNFSFSSSEKVALVSYHSLLNARCLPPNSHSSILVVTSGCLLDVGRRTIPRSLGQKDEAINVPLNYKVI